MYGIYYWYYLQCCWGLLLLQCYTAIFFEARNKETSEKVKLKSKNQHEIFKAKTSLGSSKTLQNRLKKHS